MTTATLAPTGIDAAYFMVRDMKRARAFYEEALGMKPTLEMGDEHASFVEYDLGDGTTFGLACMPHREWHTSGGLMFAVPDVAAALERVRATGVKITDEPMETPVCTMAWMEDPDGNYFCLHKRAG